MTKENQNTNQEPKDKPSQSGSYGTERETRDYRDKPKSYGTKTIPLSEGNGNSINLTEK